MSKLSPQYYESCRFCKSSKVKLVMDFGNVALAGAFLKREQFSDEQKIPMRVVFCEECYLLQIKDRVPPELLFNEYFYFSSAITTLRDHFKNYAYDITARFLKKPGTKFLEIGCNDGVLVNPVADLGVSTVIGVDPATNVVRTVNNPKIQIVNDFFSEATALKIREKFGTIDMIAANNVYAHLDDMHDVTRGIEKLLAPDGIFVFEVHYIKNLLEEKQYDMIYHEHLFYYSLLALDNFLAQFDLEVFDVKPIAIHAGSMRYYVRRVGGLTNEKVSDAVHALRAEELKNGYNKAETYLNYARAVEKTKTNLMRLLGNLVMQKKKIYGYGASGRANTLIQYCGISSDILDCIIDDAPAKLGFYTPGSHIEIRSREAIAKGNPDYILMFAWSFDKEIVAKNLDFLKHGGVFIVPLPEIRTISMKNGEVVWERPAVYDQ